MSPPGDGRFPTTHWTLIARLKSGDEATARRALDELVAQYHFPLYCAIRHRGLAHHDAEDALHDFLAKLLRLEAFADADAEKGRLRAFLGTALARFLSNWHRDHSARARDVSLDDRRPARPTPRPATAPRSSPTTRRPSGSSTASGPANSSPASSPASAPTTRRGERRPLHRALARAESAEAACAVTDTAALAATLGLSENDLRQSNLRFLQDYRALLEEEVLQTVATRAEVEAEIAHLMAAFR